MGCGCYEPDEDEQITDLLREINEKLDTLIKQEEPIVKEEPEYYKYL